MNSNQNPLCQPWGSTRSTSLATATGHPHASVHEIYAVNPLHTLKDPSKAHARPYLYSSRLLPIHVPPSPNLSSSASTPFHITATPSPVLSVQTPSTRPSPTHRSSIALPRDDTRAVPSKRARDYTPIPSTLYRVSPIPPSSEPPAKKPRRDMGPPSTVPDRRGLRLVPAKPSPPRQPSAVGASSSRPEPKHKRALPHPLAVDHGRPIQLVAPQPPICHLGSRQNWAPLPPYPENADSERLLEELKGPVDLEIARELEGLMWVQQKRVWCNRGGYSDPFLGSPIPGSLLDSKSLSSCEGATPAQSGPGIFALYGPPSRNNESIHLGERLTNPSTIAADDEEGGGFEEVLDLYRGAVQGSSLSMELDLVVGSDAEFMGVGWEAASSLEVGIKDGFGGLRTRTLAQCRRVAEVEKVASLSKHAIPRGEPLLDIEWSYSSCGYATGKVVNIHSSDFATTSKKRCWQP